MMHEFDQLADAEFELVYSLNREAEAARGYFVRLRPWEVIEAFMAD